VIDIYDEFKRDPQAAKRKYQDKHVVVRGVVHATRVTGFGIGVYLRYRNDPAGARYEQDRIFFAFFPGEKRDMGFDFRFTNEGAVIIPWSDGNTIVVSGIWEFKKDGKMGLSCPRLE